jgi:lectin-like protein
MDHFACLIHLRFPARCAQYGGRPYRDRPQFDIRRTGVLYLTPSNLGLSINKMRFTLISISILALAASGAAQSQSPEPALEDFNWTQSPNSGSWFTSEAPWYEYLDAEQMAVGLGGHLATINSSAENDWLSSTFTASINRIWIGYNDIIVENQYEWMSGDPVIWSYRNYSSSPPLDATYMRLGIADWNPDYVEYNHSNGGGAPAPSLIEVRFDPYADSDGGGVLDGYEDLNNNGVVDPFETDPNDPLDDVRVMYLRQLNPGESPLFIIRQGTPNATVYPLYSLSGDGPYDIGYGIIMDLSPPLFQVPAILLDADGKATVRIGRVPPGAPLGVPIWVQGLEVAFGANGLTLSPTNPLTLTIGGV